MSSFELNKIFAAVLVAGIVAMLAGFIAEQLMHPHEIEHDAVSIEGGAVASAGPQKAALPEPILAMIASADVARGEKLSKACAACHSFDKGGAHKVGPNMWGVVGSAKGSKVGFSYSESMTNHGGSWSYEELNKFLWKPKALIDGTKMNYIGLKKPEDRAAMVAWLRTLADSPAALPSQAQIDAEKAELAPEEESAPEQPAVESAGEESPEAEMPEEAAAGTAGE